MNIITDALALDAFGLNWWQSLLLLWVGFFVAWLLVGIIRKKRSNKNRNSPNVVNSVKGESNQGMGVSSRNDKINQPTKKEIKNDCRYKS
jgi:hypothetical protein